MCVAPDVCGSVWRPGRAVRRAPSATGAAPCLTPSGTVRDGRYTQLSTALLVVTRAGHLVAPTPTAGGEFAGSRHYLDSKVGDR